MARNRQNTEARIREAARSLLEREGFVAWGVNGIARAAGVDKVLVYRYFGSVDGLLAAVVRETRFWPDPDQLPGDSPESFIAATAAALAAQPHALALLADPGAGTARALVREKFSSDLDAWLDGLRRRCTGSIAPDQLEHLPALLLFQAASGRALLSPPDLWRQVSPPLEWAGQASPFAPAGPTDRITSTELPTELL